MRRRDFITLIGGATAAWPLAALGKTQRIAIVSSAAPVTLMSETTADDPGGLFPALFKELRRLGYVEGQNLLVERYSGEGRPSHYADMAREVVSRNPDVIITVGDNNLTLDFKTATTTIPIVGFFGARSSRGSSRVWRDQRAISLGSLQLSGRSNGASVFNCYSRWCRRRPDSRTSKRDRYASSMDPKKANGELAGLVHHSMFRQSRLSIVACLPRLSRIAPRGSR